MSLARCECGQVFDIPGVWRSYKQPDGRCAKCNGITGEPKVDVPSAVQQQFKTDSSVPLPEDDVSQYKIEKNVPFAKKASKVFTSRSKYPFDTMKAPQPDGSMESFLVPVPKGKTAKSVQVAVGSAVYAWRQRAKAQGHKNAKAEFKSRAVQGGVRVWRTK